MYDTIHHHLEHGGAGFTAVIPFNQGVCKMMYGRARSPTFLSSCRAGPLSHILGPARTHYWNVIRLLLPLNATLSTARCIVAQYLPCDLLYSSHREIICQEVSPLHFFFQLPIVLLQHLWSIVLVISGRYLPRIFFPA